MKRILAMCLVIGLLFGLSGCGTKETETAEPAEEVKTEPASEEESLENILADSLMGFGLQKIIDALGSDIASIGVVDHDSIAGLALVYIEVCLAGDGSEDDVMGEDAVIRMAYSVVADATRLITEEDAKTYVESLGWDFSEFSEVRVSDVQDMYFSNHVEVVSGSLTEGELTTLEGVMTKVIESYQDNGGTSTKAADFDTTDIQGKKVNSLDVFSEAEMTLLCIWTSWSVPGEKELVQLQKLQDELSGSGLQVVLLLWDASSYDSDTAQAARDIMEKNNIDLPCLLFTSGLSAIFNKSGYPASFLLSADGKLLTGELWGMYTVDEYLDWILEQTGIELSVS